MEEQRLSDSSPLPLVVLPAELLVEAYFESDFELDCKEYLVYFLFVALAPDIVVF